ncbi:MAG: TonB-dependent receptor [bacterium]
MVTNSLYQFVKYVSILLYCIVFSCLLILPQTVLAQANGQIYGRVSDADTKEYLPGANVRLQGTSIGAATNKDGDYRLSNLSPGSYELVVSYIGYVSQSINIKVDGSNLKVRQNVALKAGAVEMAVVEITGLRKGQTKAINIQKTSDNILSVVSQEQMVQLPDLNTAEILQRISGISIVRDQGEGRYVQIRGTDARLTSISVNGERIVAPDPGERFVGMDVISASQAASIEVVKAITPDLDADAIGGSVNIKTKSAFDSDKPFFNIQAGSGYSDIFGKPLWQGGFTYGTKFGSDDKFGIAVTGNYDQWKRETWDVETAYDDKATTTGVALPMTLVDFDMRNYNISRERFNVAGNLDYHPSEDINFFIRGMFNNRDDIENRRNLYIRPSKGTFQADANTIKDAKIYMGLKDRLERQSIMALSAGGIHKMDNLNLDYTIGYNFGQTEKADETDPNFVMIKKVGLTLDRSNPNKPLYNVTTVGAAYDQFNPDNFKLDAVKYNNDLATDKDILGSANLKYSFRLAEFPSELKVGGKMHIREKVKNQDRWVYGWKGASDLLMTQFVGDEATILDGTYRLGRILDGKFRSYFQSQKDKSTGFVGAIDHQASEAASFTANEKTGAYYVMNTLNMDQWMFLVGVRHEFTSLTNKSSQVLLDANGDYVSTTGMESELSYNNFLPTAHIRYKLTPMSNIRLAFTSSLARPNFYDLVPYRNVDAEAEEISEGNSMLKPTTATNLDLMAEHYFQTGGMISGGVFYKKLNDIIFTQTKRLVGGIYDKYYYFQPVNGGSSTLIGFEFNWEQQMRFLPGFWDGLGLSVNYAYTKATADVGGRLERSELPGQAANVANFSISYEKFGFTGRFSISYNGKFTEEVGTDAQHDRIYKEHMQMDFSASQQVYKGLQVYLEVINLNKEPMIYYMGQESRPLQQEFYSWWMHAGVKFNM